MATASATRAIRARAVRRTSAATGAWTSRRRVPAPGAAARRHAVHGLRRLQHERALRGRLVCRQSLICPDPGRAASPPRALRPNGCVSVPRPNGWRATTAIAHRERRVHDGSLPRHARRRVSVDQYKCYRSSGGQPVDDTTTTPTASARPRHPPAGVVHVQCRTDGAPVFDDDRHLTCWRTRQTSSTPRRTLTLRDRFAVRVRPVETGRLLRAVRGARRAPHRRTSTSLRVPRARPEALGRRAHAGGPVRDARHVVLSRQPSASGQRNGAPLVDPTAHLFCYKLASRGLPAMDSHNLTLSSPLGGEALARAAAAFLCVPARRAVRTLTSVTARDDRVRRTAVQPGAGRAFRRPALRRHLRRQRRLEPRRGCTYFGGGNSVIYPSKQQVVGTTLTLTPSRLRDTLELTAEPETGPGECQFDRPSEDLSQRQLQELYCGADCGGPAGSCAPIPRCFAAPPQPFVNTLAASAS